MSTDKKLKNFDEAIEALKSKDGYRGIYRDYNAYMYIKAGARQNTFQPKSRGYYMSQVIEMLDDPDVSSKARECLADKLSQDIINPEAGDVYTYAEQQQIVGKMVKMVDAMPTVSMRHPVIINSLAKIMASDTCVMPLTQYKFCCDAIMKCTQSSYSGKIREKAYETMGDLLMLENNPLPDKADYAGRLLQGYEESKDMKAVSWGFLQKISQDKDFMTASLNKALEFEQASDRGAKFINYAQEIQILYRANEDAYAIESSFEKSIRNKLVYHKRYGVSYDENDNNFKLIKLTASR